MDQDQSQLTLFSWQNEVSAEGYEQLASFSFEEAEFVFLQLSEKYSSTTPEMEEGLFYTRHWRKVFEHLENTNSVKDIAFLHQEISQFNFRNSWGPQQLRLALISHLIELMQQQKLFYVNDKITLSDLFLQIEKYKEAEQVLTGRLSEAMQDNNLRFRLAQIQWRTKQKREAKRNYALGLLLNPDSVPSQFIEGSEIADLLSTYGPEMTPAYGWVSGVLPLVQLPDDITPENDIHRKALTCYRLLKKAEKASGNRDLDATVEYRKALKKSDPEFYDEYFALISKRKIPR